MHPLHNIVVVVALSSIAILSDSLGVLGQEDAETDHLEPCLIYVNCDKNVDEQYVTRNEDVNAKVMPEDVKDATEYLRTSEVYDFESDEMDSVLIEFCSLDSEKQDEIFATLTGKIFGDFTAFCIDPLQSDKCDRWSEIAETGTQLLDDMHGENVC